MTEKCKQFRSFKGLSNLNKEIRTLIRPILGKHGFTNTDIITYWQEIVGEELAKGILPDKLIFKKNERSNGILQVKSASGAFALLFQHKKKHILDKINSFFGFQAVGDIRIIQGGLKPKFPSCFEEKKEPPSKKVVQDLTEKVQIVKDEELQDLLIRIGLEVQDKK